MKKLKLLLFLLLNTSYFFAQSSNYEISSFLEIGNKAENIHHIGNAWLNFLSSSDENYDYNIVLATFPVRVALASPVLFGGIDATSSTSVKASPILTGDFRQTMFARIDLNSPILLATLKQHFCYN